MITIRDSGLPFFLIISTSFSPSLTLNCASKSTASCGPETRVELTAKVLFLRVVSLQRQRRREDRAAEQGGSNSKGR